MNKIIKILIIFLIPIVVICYFLVNKLIGNQKLDMTKTPFSLEQRQFIKKYFFLINTILKKTKL